MRTGYLKVEIYDTGCGMKTRRAKQAFQEVLTNSC